MEIYRLKKDDYDELIELLNSVFGREKNVEKDFEAELPKMCVRDDEHMQKHFGIRENGKLVAALGIYPLPTMVAGEEIMFSTVGNVATHWDYVGKGYMNILLQEAMKELDRIGADASRLSGYRTRYGRFGFESCGTNYTFSLNEKNVSFFYSDIDDGIEFSVIEKDDIEALAFCKKVYDMVEAMVIRSSDNCYSDVYNSMVAWKNVPYLAKNKNGEMIGYLCTKNENDHLAEIYAVDNNAFKNILAAWQKRVGKEVFFPIYAFQTELLREYSRTCESLSIEEASRIKIINFQKLVNAYIKLKCLTEKMSNGEFVLNILEYGKLCIYVNDGEAGCVFTDKPEDLTLDKKEASRFIFGPLPANLVCSVSGVVKEWFPLPLSWNGQNRI